MLVGAILFRNDGQLDRDDFKDTVSNSFSAKRDEFSEACYTLSENELIQCSQRLSDFRSIYQEDKGGFNQSWLSDSQVDALAVKFSNSVSSNKINYFSTQVFSFLCDLDEVKIPVEVGEEVEDKVSTKRRKKNSSTPMELVISPDLIRGVYEAIIERYKLENIFNDQIDGYKSKHHMIVNYPSAQHWMYVFIDMETKSCYVKDPKEDESDCQTVLGVFQYFILMQYEEYSNTEVIGCNGWSFKIIKDELVQGKKDSKNCGVLCLMYLLRSILIHASADSSKNYLRENLSSKPIKQETVLQIRKRLVLFLLSNNNQQEEILNYLKSILIGSEEAGSDTKYSNTLYNPSALAKDQAPLTSLDIHNIVTKFLKSFENIGHYWSTEFFNFLCNESLCDIKKTGKKKMTVVEKNLNVDALDQHTCFSLFTGPKKFHHMIVNYPTETQWMYVIIDKENQLCVVMDPKGSKLNGNFVLEVFKHIIDCALCGNLKNEFEKWRFCLDVKYTIPDKINSGVVSVLLLFQTIYLYSHAKSGKKSKLFEVTASKLKEYRWKMQTLLLRNDDEDMQQFLVYIESLLLERDDTVDDDDATVEFESSESIVEGNEKDDGQNGSACKYGVCDLQNSSSPEKLKSNVKDITRWTIDTILQTNLPMDETIIPDLILASFHRLLATPNVILGQNLDGKNIINKGWLCSGVISKYLVVLNKAFPHVNLFDSYFYQSYNPTPDVFNFSKIQKNTNKFGILHGTKESWLVINVDEWHWVLLGIKPLTKIVEFYDPMHSPKLFQRYIATSKMFLREAASPKTFNVEEWKFVCRTAQDSPHQTNGIDCGVFVLQFIYHYLNDGVVTMDSFSAEAMSQYRREICNQILNYHYEIEFLGDPIVLDTDTDMDMDMDTIEDNMMKSTEDNVTLKRKYSRSPPLPLGALNRPLTPSPPSTPPSTPPPTPPPTAVEKALNEFKKSKHIGKYNSNSKLVISSPGNSKNVTEQSMEDTNSSSMAINNSSSVTNKRKHLPEQRDALLAMGIDSNLVNSWDFEVMSYTNKYESTCLLK